MKRLALLFTVPLLFVLAACSNEAPPSPELEGQWAGNVEGHAVDFEVAPDGHVVSRSLEITYGGETLTVDFDSRATGRTIQITIQAEHSSGISFSYVLNGTVDGDTISGDYTLTLTTDEASLESDGTFTFTRVEES